MFLLVEGVKRFVVRLAAVPYLPEDLQPALTQTTQRAGMAFAFLPLRLVVSLCPGTKLPTAITPQMHRVAQVTVTMPADFSASGLPADITDGRGSCQALQRLGVGIFRAMGTDLAQQSRRQLIAGSRQTPK